MRVVPILTIRMGAFANVTENAVSLTSSERLVFNKIRHLLRKYLCQMDRNGGYLPSKMGVYAFGREILSRELPTQAVECISVAVCVLLDMYMHVFMWLEGTAM